VFAALLLLFGIVKIPALLAAENEIADQFSREVLAFGRVVAGSDWLSPASPWAPYLDRQYREGLSDVQQKQYFALQEEGRCEELVALEEIGFRGLYPEISPALSDKMVNTVFTREIIPFQSFGTRRCRALSMLNPIIENEKKLDPEYYYLSIPGTNLGTKPGRIYDPREIILRKAFAILFELAACENYRPAIKDVIKYRKLYLIFVSSEEVLYFRARAKQYGLDVSGFDPLVLNLGDQYGISQRRDKIRDILARGDLEGLRNLAFSRTYISCGRGALE